MTRMIDAVSEKPAAQRILIALLLGFVGLFLIGMAVGVIAAMVEEGEMPRRAWVAALPLVTAPLGALGLFLAWRIAAPPSTAGGYEKRYWRTWLLIMAISMVVGIIFAATTDMGDIGNYNPFASTPISSTAAVLLAILVTVAFAATLVLYHRAIDDHEERAYLWGSQLAYYFLIVAFPAWWLLERGGLVGPITTGTAFIAILISFVVQGAVWAWLKFR